MNLENVKFIGRVIPLEDTLWMALSGTGVEFSVTGTYAKITLVADDTWNGVPENRARVAVYVDGERTVDVMLDMPEKTVTAFAGETKKSHVVRVIKLSESAMSTCGISEIVTDGEVIPTKNKSHLIEFIGDSITCGYGADDEDKDHHFATGTEDVTKAYAYKTVVTLDADYSMVSFSGYGIISGYTENGEKSKHQLVPDYYEKLGFSYGTYKETCKPQNVMWDFTKRQPDLVVINLGTNDNSYVAGIEDRKEDYVTKYEEFLETVRRRNPHAKILCTLGIMGTDLCPAMEDAVASYRRKTGDKNIFSMRFSEQLPEDGLTADWHPTAVTHTKAAGKLAEEIKMIMGW